MKSQTERIKILNKAWKMMKEALLLTKKAFPKDRYIKYYVWKLGKINDNMQRYIYTKLQTNIINNEWDKIVKKLKEKK